MEEEEMTSLFSTAQYSNFFYPNICHVCKFQWRQAMECPLCHMISYCSVEHMRLDRPQHKEICEAIELANQFKDMRIPHGIALERSVQFKENCVQFVNNILQRDLMPYEAQMFLFAKSCFVCHRQDGPFHLCRGCLSVNLCPDHILTAAAHPCSLLKLCLKLNCHDAYKMDRQQRILADDTFWNVKRFCARDMKEFINDCVRDCGPIARWSLTDYILSDDFSAPLTVLYGLRCINMLPKSGKPCEFVIYVIAETSMDMRSMSAWEIILHEFPSRSKLRIVTVGSTLKDTSIFVNTCESCKDGFRNLQYDNRCSRYDTYVRRARCKQPDVIVAFDVDLRDVEALMMTVSAYWHRKCPLLLTVASKTQANANISMMWKMLKPRVYPVFNGRNKFASFRPHRDYKTDSVTCLNQYLIVYKDSNG